MLLETHVRPHPEYAAVVWDPYQAGLFNNHLKTFRNLLLRPLLNNGILYNDLLNICQMAEQRRLVQRRQYSKTHHALQGIQWFYPYT